MSRLMIFACFNTPSLIVALVNGNWKSFLLCALATGTVLIAQLAVGE